MQEYIHVLNIYLLGGYMFFLLVNAIYVIFRKEHLYHVTGGVLLWWSFLSLISIVDYLPIAQEIPNYDYIMSMFDLSAVPTMVFLLRVLTGKRKVNAFMIFCHEIVYAVLLILLIVTGKYLVFQIAKFYTLVYVLFYWMLAFWVLKKYEHSILEYYSNLERRDLNWLRNCIIAAPFIFPLWLVMTETNFMFGRLAYHLFSMAVWTFIVYHIIHQVPVDLQDYKLRQNPVDSSKYPFAQKLQNICKSPSFFTRPNLTIDDLVEKVQAPKNDVLQYIKNELHSSFYDLINESRMDYAADLLLGSHKNNEYIATACGFNTVNAFEAAFRDYFYCTPDEYRQMDETEK